MKKILEFTNKLIALKAYDAKTYTTLVNLCFGVGIVGGFVGGLWLALVAWIIFVL